MARVQLHTLYSPTPHHVDPLTSTLDSTLLGGALEAEGEEAGTRRKRRGRGGEGRRRARRSPPGPARGRADASRTPRARKAGGGEDGSPRPSHYGGAEATRILADLLHPPGAQRPWSVPLAHVAKDGHLR